MEKSEDLQPPLSPIQEFYNGKNIFITGATGFLGRLLLEKLLRSCNARTIYILIREKKGKDMNTRLKELFSGIVFDRLNKECPEFPSRIVCVYGDCSRLNLGLTEEDVNTLIENVNIVFHCAATVNFDEKVHTATLINIRGTREILQIAKRMKQLKFFMHVSTAYAHCTSLHLTETFYPATYKPRQLITLVEELSESTIDRMEPILVGEFPNTYAFTKSISEQLIAELEDFPIAVFRPAIIVSTYKEPLSGWINNFYGPQGVMAGAMVGLLRTMHCDENVNANIVPADMCVNALIAIPWEARQRYDKAIEVDRCKYTAPIYHYESNSINPISWREFKYWNARLGIKLVSLKTIGTYFFHLRKQYYFYYIERIFVHYLPALLFDFVLLCSGKKAKMVKAYQRIHKFTWVISYFCTKNWIFESKNLISLCDKMEENDAQLFFCDMRHLDWPLFFKSYLLGCRLYLLKDPLETLPEARRKYKMVTWATYLFLSVLAVLLLYLTYNIFCV